MIDKQAEAQAEQRCPWEPLDLGFQRQAGPPVYGAHPFVHPTVGKAPQRILPIVTGGWFVTTLLLTLVVAIVLVRDAILSEQLGTSIDLGAWITTETIDRWAMVLGILLVILSVGVMARVIHRAGFLASWPYYRTLGWKTIARIFLRTLFDDWLAVRTLRTNDKRRWAIHGLILYGFILMLASTTVADFLNKENNPHGFWWISRILGNAGGLSSMIGLCFIAWRLWKDDFENNGKTWIGDIAFVFLLTMTIVTGFATEFTTYGTNIQAAHVAFGVHLGFIIVLLENAPFTRFNHVLITPVLAFFTHLNEALVASHRVAAYEEEPAPGRHAKSERIVADAIRHIAPDARPPVRIRYFP
ncbi:MAG: hypothetical protein IMW91_04630 [Firmicutes bacterium]|nr:hypothetical protein [Bacillota bacterium]